VSYDPHAVAAFLDLVAGLEVNLFSDGSFRVADSPTAIRAIHAFEALSPWERANVLYGMRDRALDGMNARIARAVKAAREDDDRRSNS
jgi:hypothetical protein